MWLYRTCLSGKSSSSQLEEACRSRSRQVHVHVPTSWCRLWRSIQKIIQKIFVFTQFAFTKLWLTVLYHGLERNCSPQHASKAAQPTSSVSQTLLEVEATHHILMPIGWTKDHYSVAHPHHRTVQYWAMGAWESVATKCSYDVLDHLLRFLKFFWWLIYSRVQSTMP